jgi:hypothetical protein
MPKRKRKVQGKYISSLAITIAVLLIGMFIGLKINEMRFSRIENLKSDIEISLKENEILEYLFQENPCDVDISKIHPRLDRIQSEITVLEQQLGKNHPQIIEVKKPYSLILLKQHFLYLERKEICDTEEKIILFFYSNKKENLKQSENQGFVLDYIKSRYSKEKIVVFAIDYDLGLGSLEIIKQRYNLTKTPSLVINEITYSGFQETLDLLEILDINQ